MGIHWQYFRSPGNFHGNFAPAWLIMYNKGVRACMQRRQAGHAHTLPDQYYCFYLHVRVCVSAAVNNCLRATEQAGALHPPTHHRHEHNYANPVDRSCLQITTARGRSREVQTLAS